MFLGFSWSVTDRAEGMFGVSEGFGDEVVVLAHGSD
jgi:hypothetical protein